MRLHHSGIFAADLNLESNLYIRMDKVERRALNDVVWCHETYDFVDANPRNYRHIREACVEPIFDYGAREIDQKSPAKYARFIENDPDIVFYPIALHVQGNAAANWQLLRTMEEAGARPCPIVCFGDGNEVLHYYMHNYTRLAIGAPPSGCSVQSYRAFLDRVWAALVGIDGRPTREVHGCHIPFELIAPYPWTSVHTNAWRSLSHAGNIFIPRTGKTLDVSHVSSRSKTPGAHYFGLHEAERAAVDAMITERGFDPERLGRLPVARYAWNLAALTQYFDDNPPASTFTGGIQELFA